MPLTVQRPMAFTPPRKQTLNYTPPGGVFDEFGNRVESATGSLPGESSPDFFPVPPGQGQTSTFPGRKVGNGFPQEPTGLPNYFAGAPSAGLPATPTFSTNPQPQSGTGPFGQVPGPLGVPDVFGNLQKPIANLPQLNAAASEAILSNIHGELSPSTVAAIQDAAARFGISSGMPGSGLAANRSLRDIGLTSEQQRALGLSQLNPFVSTVSGTQTVRPETQIALAEQNAINASAPNPQAQSSYAEELFNKYLNQVQGVNGTNPAGGTGTFAARTPYPQNNTAPAPAVPVSPFAPINGGAVRSTWQNSPWIGDRLGGMFGTGDTIEWGPQSFWK